MEHSLDEYPFARVSVISQVFCIIFVSEKLATSSISQNGKFFIDIFAFPKRFQETTCPKDRLDGSWLGPCMHASRRVKIRNVTRQNVSDYGFLKKECFFLRASVSST